MPKVGKEQFDYTSEGIAEAKALSEATGIPISNAQDRMETYQIGGKVSKKKGSDVLDITRNIAQKERFSKKRPGASDLTYKEKREYYTKSSQKAIEEFDWGKGKKKK